jgi:Ca-activated chloride channel family protein
VALAASGGAGKTARAQELERPGPGAAALEVRSETGNASALPLVEETLLVRLDDGHATVTHRDAFQNESTARLEGTYKLVVGEGATATGFSYWNGEERVVGEMFEREKAQQIYEALSGLRRDPGLLEQTGEGAFSFRVFPIEPGEKKRVEVVTSQLLPRRRGKVEYRARVGRADAKIELEVRDVRGVTSIESPSHAITTTALADGGARVTVGAAKSASDDELVLTYVPNDAVGVLHVSVHKNEGPAYFNLSLGTAMAPAGQARAAHDVTLVLDRSGSMSGAPMEAAKAAAKRVVDLLEPTDAVNVIAFDDEVDSLFDKPHALDAKTRREVAQFVSGIDARGGTDIAGALQRALAAQAKDERPDVVFFMTDGQSDGPSAIRVASGDTSETRVFTVGLGEGVDKALLARIASLRHGRFTFVPDARAVTAALPKFVSQLASPVLTDLKITGEGANVDLVYPQSLPDLFSDDELRVSGRITTSTPNAKIVLEAKEKGTPRRFEVPVDAASQTTKPWVARTWAHARVDDLLGLERGTQDQKERDGMHDEIVDLGLTYAVVTPYTSFLAVPEKELDEAAKDTIASVRERRAKLLAANKDAAALSRLNMPPGDPILRVAAPRDAQGVTAYFPFGLVQDLHWDEGTEQWMTRFLVPKNVPDGVYDVKVAVTHADGHVEASITQYTIDAKEPAFEVLVEPRAGGAFVRVLVDEPAKEVRVAEGVHAENAASLTPSADGLTFTGFVPLAGGMHALRVVVADRARNESDRLMTVQVTP